MAPCIQWIKHPAYDARARFREPNTVKRASLAAQLVKNLPAMQETLVRFLGQEDPLGEGMATYSSILDWRMRQESPCPGSGTDEPGRVQSVGSQRVGHDLATKHSTKSEVRCTQNPIPGMRVCKVS